MARLSNWVNLECLDCGCDMFFEPYHLRRHPTGGTSQDPAGHICRNCLKDADPNKMWHKIMVSRRKEDLKQLMLEMQRGLDPASGDELTPEMLQMMMDMQIAPLDEEVVPPAVESDPPVPAKKRSLSPKKGT